MLQDARTETELRHVEAWSSVFNVKLYVMHTWTRAPQWTQSWFIKRHQNEFSKKEIRSQMSECNSDKFQSTYNWFLYLRYVRAHLPNATSQDNVYVHVRSSASASLCLLRQTREVLLQYVGVLCSLVVFHHEAIAVLGALNHRRNIYENNNNDLLCTFFKRTRGCWTHVCRNRVGRDTKCSCWGHRRARSHTQHRATVESPQQQELNWRNLNIKIECNCDYLRIMTTTLFHRWPGAASRCLGRESLSRCVLLYLL